MASSRKVDPFLRDVTLLRDRVASFDVYPFCIPGVRSLDRIEFHPEITFFVGENATGKSTLLEGIAVTEGFNAEGGSRNFNFSTRATHSSLGEYLRLGKGLRSLKDSDGFFLRAESFYNVATQVEDLGPGLLRSYGGKSLHQLSHGESFFALLCDRFWGNGLYLLDEPESALSPSRQLSMLAVMRRLIGEGSQFLIATHSPILMAYPGAWIYQFSQQGIRRVEYTETEHYKVTKSFLERREQMLDELFRAD
ncbi:MAG TPA: AAA family ATPase [Pirellulales bacterium]